MELLIHELTAPRWPARRRLFGTFETCRLPLRMSGYRWVKKCIAMRSWPVG